MDDAAKLKTELAELNQKCLVARDNEIRYGLQRSRLEAERATLLARLIEAASLPDAVPYRIVVRDSGVPVVTVGSPPGHQKKRLRPNGIPPMPEMS
jgi:hypothetical protein